MRVCCDGMHDDDGWEQQKSQARETRLARWMGACRSIHDDWADLAGNGNGHGYERVSGEREKEVR